MIGGLGNQLFQYATALSYSKSLDRKLYVDTSFYKRNVMHGGYRLENLSIQELNYFSSNRSIFSVLNISMRFAVVLKVICRCFYLDRFRLELADGKPYVFLAGYWQDPSVFMNERSHLKKILRPRKISEKVNSESVLMSHPESVSLHVRRGDYVNNRKALKVHGICSLDYYRKAILYMKEVLGDPEFFIFSNDDEWARVNLKEVLEGAKCYFISGNSQEEDLYLMSLAKNHIVANSSFSWWGAFLASSEKQVVISPFPWYDEKPKNSKDPSLSDWVRLAK